MRVQKRCQNGQETPTNKGEGGSADWVIIVIYRLREYLDHTYRQLLHVLQEVPDIVTNIGLSADKRPHFTAM
jgi:IS5 family transposase